MVALTALFLVLGSASLSVGALIDVLLGTTQAFRASADRLLAQSWVGLCTVAWCCLVVAGVTAVSAGAALFVLGLCHAPLLLPRVRRGIWASLAFVSWAHVLAFALVVTGVSAFCSQLVLWGDTGLYHQQLIRWMAEHGLVRGLALLHDRFGFTSSWFALSAALQHGPLAARLTAGAGGFALLLALLQWTSATARVLRGSASRADRFATVAWTIAVPVLVRWELPVSPSPDWPVGAVAIVAAWMVLGAAGDEARPAALRLALWLGASALALKPGAAPIPFVVGAALFAVARRPRAVALALGMCLLFALPVAWANFRTSGCPAYPLGVGCDEGPRGVGAAAARGMAALIRDWAWWGRSAAPEASPAEWLREWIRHETFSALLVGLTLLCAAALLLRHRPAAPAAEEASAAGRIVVLALALAGTTYLLATAPLLRFGLGFLVLTPALLAAELSWRGPPRRLTFYGPTGGLVPVAAVIAVTLALWTTLAPNSFERQVASAHAREGLGARLGAHVVIPPALANLEVATRRRGHRVEVIGVRQLELGRGQAHDFTYLLPLNDTRCWDAPLPCAPGPRPDLALGDPARGLAGGFRRVTAPSASRSAPRR